jgi:hypothetical protein
MSESEKNITEKQGLLIALVIASSVLLWALIQGAAPSLGISARYMLLIDFFDFSGVGLVFDFVV